MSDPAEPEAASYQSLYRRFRPQRFEEVLGQEHVSLALRNAVRDGRVGHAHLFSGPRGTGKTSTARILAKALDCAAPVDGEPCGVCDSCVEIARGTSMDVHELDAASNNGVDAMRDLVAHSALGTPGRWKVYIVDEVHMLSTAASNALLKTLEEPPPHVVFVLATTDAQKVLPTIRSRTQHFEFRLLGPDVIAGLLERVCRDAALEVGDDAIDSAVRRGRGSARDALSALDQVAAGGSVSDEISTLADLADALAERDANTVLVQVAKAAEAGHDSQRLAAELADYLRQGFLTVLGPDLVSMAGDERARVAETARRMGLPALVRAMETLGRAVVEMRDTPDPRVHLEAALIRLAHPEMDDSATALLERIERLERALSSGATSTGPTAPRTIEAPRRNTDAPAPARAEALPAREETRGGASSGRSRGEGRGPVQGTAPEGEADSAPERAAGEGPASGPELARRALSEVRQAPGKGAATGRAAGDSSRLQSTGASPEPTRGSRAQGPTGATMSATFPSRDKLVQVWGDGVLAELPPKARVRFRMGRFVQTHESSAVFALPNESHRASCEEVRTDVEQALGRHFGTPVALKLVVDEEGTEDAAVQATAPRAVRVTEPRGDRGEGDQDETHEPDLLDPTVLEAETEPAGSGPTPEERIKLAFPGAEEV